MNKPDPGSRLVQLDGLRGLAALVIMLYHLEMVFRSHGPFVRGYLMVDLFYLLSGFVLAVSTERKLAGGIGALAFTRARFVRLWPLVAVGAGLAVVRAFFIGMADPLTLLFWLALDLAMIPVLTGVGPFYRFNGPQWTLFWEIVANFLHALLLRRVPTRWLPLLAACFGAGLVLVVQDHGADNVGVSALTWETWYRPIARVGWSYVLGVWMGRVYREGLRTSGLPWHLALLLAVGGIMALPYLPISRATGDLAFVMAFMPLVMWNVAMSRPPQAIGRMLEWLGNYSLPLYCVHLTVLVWISELLGREVWVRFLAVAAALALSYLCSRLISFKGKPIAAAAVREPQQ